MIATVTCSFCRGSKVAEVLEVRLAFELGWAKARRFESDDAMRKAIDAHPASFRWVDHVCPSCDGRGEYEVEGGPFKVF